MSKVSRREQIGSILTCPKLGKSQKNDQFENLYIMQKLETSNLDSS